MFEFDFDYDAPDWDADRAPDSATASDGTGNDTGLRASARKAYEEARRRWREMTGKTRGTDLDTRTAGPNTDRLRLHNGEVVSGEIGKIEGDIIHVKTADGKDREVRRQDIARVEFKTGPRVNFGVTVVDSHGTGARVTQVAPGSAAGKAGVQVGDVITKCRSGAARLHRPCPRPRPSPPPGGVGGEGKASSGRPTRGGAGPGSARRA